MIKKRHFTYIAWSFSFNYDEYLLHHKKWDVDDPIVTKERYTELYAKYNARMIKDINNGI